MNTYIYTLKLIKRLWSDEAWTDRDEAIVAEHFNRLKIDFERGIVLHAGRTEKTDAGGFGIVIFKATDLRIAEKYMQNDPVVAQGIMEANCQLYRIALG